MTGYPQAAQRERVESSCSNCGFLGMKEWEGLDEAGLQRLSSAKVSRSYKKGEYIYHQGDSIQGLWCLTRGMVSLNAMDANGKSVVVGLAPEGSTLGSRAFFAEEPHSTSAQAVSAVNACFIRREVVSELIENYPVLARSFLRQISKGLREAHETILRGATLSLRGRLAHLMLLFGDRYGVATAEGERSFMLPLSRRDIAALLGTCPESLSRTIRKLQDDQLVRFNARKVSIPSIAKLMGEVESDRTLPPRRFGGVSNNAASLRSKIKNNPPKAWTDPLI